MAERIDREELRALIREALKEALAQPSPPPRSGLPDLGIKAPKSGKPDFGRERVVRPQDRLGEGPSKRATTNPSPSRFAATPSPQGGRGSAPQGVLNLSAGVLTEAAVREVARTHRKIVVGAGVAVTPLARDKARELKILIERQKP
jgi:hypothetical protein